RVRGVRLRRAAPAGATVEPPGLAGAGRPLYSRSDRGRPGRLVLAPEARWVAEYYETDHSAEGPGGSLEVTLPTRHLAWVARLVLRLGGAVTVLGPPELQEEVRRVADLALRRYANGS